MPKGKVTINGVMIDLGSVKFFNKKERFSRNQPSSNTKAGCKDSGIEFTFYGGGKKTIWWTHTTYYAFSCGSDSERERDSYYSKLTRDFGIEKY